MNILTYLAKGFLWVAYLVGCITIGVYVRVNWLAPATQVEAPIIEEQAVQDPATRNVWSDV